MDEQLDELNDIVNAMLPMIEEKINAAPSSFKLWFGGLKLISLDDSSAIFTTPTPLRQKILYTKYIGVIKESLEEVIGFVVNIEIRSVTSSTLKNDPPEDEVNVGISIPAVPSLIDGDEDDDDDEEIISDILSGSSRDKKTRIDEYTFDNFVEGSSNKFARAACFAVANEPTVYNPLFIYGHSGLGKTHLLYAVINHMKKNHPDLKIVYKKSEGFLEELVQAIRDGSTTPFKEKYRTADVLLIDDIQLLAGKEQTQEEFFHTFNALYESDKQIIMTSDRPPKEIKPLTDRLRTRFEGGLLADVQPPSYELRTAIIRKKSDAMGLQVSNDLVEYMAERLQNNIRQIEGVLKRLYAVSSLTGTQVTKSKIDEVISIIDPGNIPTDAMIERILTAVSKSYGVPIENIKSKKKTDNIANARHVAIYIIKHLTELTLKEIGSIFERDHSTVINSLDKVECNIKTVNNYETEINRIIKEVKG